MKNDIVLYKRIYQLIKGQIECGLLPRGSKLPSRADLCGEFHVSEKTMRRVLQLLAEEGFIESAKRKRPVVINIPPAGIKGKRACIPVDEATAQDLFQTGRLICYPVIKQGVALCTKEEWKIPSAIVERMNPAHGLEFWRLSNRLWRFFIARNGNDLILRAVDSLGFSKIDPLPGSLAARETYLKNMQEFMRIARIGGDLKSVPFDGLSFLYGFSEHALLGNFYRIAPDSPLYTGFNGLEQRIRSAEERYSRVYMDILGLIAVGRYRPGDRLPSHLALQKIYGVSADTTNKAIRILQDWGVVTAKRGSGIYVAMDLTALKRTHIPEEMIACHLRRFLDSMELLCLTVRGAAAHAAAFITTGEAEKFLQAARRHWEEEYLYQIMPIALLQFITEHIPYTALKEIYRVVSKYYRTGRGVPRLVTPGKTAKNVEIHLRAVEAVESLTQGCEEDFSEKISELFWYIRQLVIAECKRLGYWQIAQQVYDSRALWQERHISKAAGRQKSVSEETGKR